MSFPTAGYIAIFCGNKMSGSNCFGFLLWEPKCPLKFLNRNGHQFGLHYVIVRGPVDAVGVTCTYGTKPGARHEFWGSFPRPRNYVPVGLWGSVLGKPIKFWVLILLKSPNGGHLGLRYRRPTFLIDIQQMTSPLLVSAEVCDLLIAFRCSCVNVVRRGGQRPTSPASSTVSYERNDFAVIQYGPTSCDNGDTRHHQHVRPLSQNLIWPPSNDKLTTPSSTLDRCPQPTSGPACFQAGGQCPLNAASHHCRRCSAALRTISQLSLIHISEPTRPY